MSALMAAYSAQARYGGRSPAAPCVLAQMVVCAALVCAIVSLPSNAPSQTLPDARSATLDRYGDRLPQCAVARLGTLRLRANHTIRGIAFSPDGTMLVSTDRGSDIRLWRVADGRLLQKQSVFPMGAALSDEAKEVQFAPDGTAVAVSCGSKILFWEFKREANTRLLGADNRHVGPVRFSPDGEFLAWATTRYGPSRPALVFWHIPTGDQVRELPMVREHDDAGSSSEDLVEAINRTVRSFAFAPDGKTIAVGFSSGHVEVLNAANGAVRLSLRGDPGHIIRRVAFTPDGAHVAADTRDGLILWNSNTGAETARMWSTGRKVADWAFCPGDKEGLVALLEGSGELLKWDLEKSVQHLDDAPRGSGRLVVSSDDNLLAVAGSSSAITIRRFHEHKPVPDLKGHESGIRALCYLNEGRLLATLGYDHRILLWSVVNGELMREWLHPEIFIHNACSSQQIAVNPADTSTLAMAVANGRIEFWDVVRNVHVRTLEHEGVEFINAISFSPDGNRVAGGDLAGRVVVWNTHSGKGRAYRSEMAKDHDDQGKRVAEGPWQDGKTLRLAASGRSDAILSLAWSPDGQLLASASATKMQYLDMKSERVREISQFRESRHRFIVFSPDGKHLAGLDESALRLTSVATGKTVWKREGITSQMVSFSPDGTVLATACEGDAIHLLCASTGKTVAVATGHSGDISTFAFHGERLASGSSDTTILVWDIPCIRSKDRGPGIPGGLRKSGSQRVNGGQCLDLLSPSTGFRL